jgi:hypothetical protein
MLPVKERRRPRKAKPPANTLEFGKYEGGELHFVPWNINTYIMQHSALTAIQLRSSSDVVVCDLVVIVRSIDVFFVLWKRHGRCRFHAFCGVILYQLACFYAFCSQNDLLMCSFELDLAKIASSREEQSTG